MQMSWRSLFRQLGFLQPRQPARKRRSGLSVETLEDRTTPTVLLSVTGAPNPLTDAGAPGTFTLRVVFDGRMSTSVTPTLTFPTAGENPGTSLSFVSHSFATTTVTDDTYVATYNAFDQNVSIPNIDVNVANARNVVGELVAAQTAANVFTINTQQPIVTSVGVSDTLIQAADVGGIFSIQITYREAMRTDIAPAITFSQSVISTLSFRNGSWNGAGTVYTENYNISGSNVVIPSININVSGAQNVNNFLQFSFTQTNAFSIDTRSNSSSDFPTGSSMRVVGDFNGDTLSDVAAYFPSNGRWFVSLSTGAGFLAPQIWTQFGTKTGWTQQLVGDFNGDGKDDIANFYQTSSYAQLWVTVSNGSSFTTSLWGSLSGAKLSYRNLLVGDFNGDLKDDIASFYNPSGAARWWVSISSGTSFTTTRWFDFVNISTSGWTTFVAGDFNEDGKDDIANLFNPSRARWWVSISNGTGFSTTHWGELPASSANAWALSKAGDFNNDGRIDIASYNRTTGDWWVSLSSGSTFSISFWLDLLPSSSYLQTVGDFNNDNRADIAVVSNTATPIGVGRSNGTSFAFSQWGALPYTTGLLSELVGDFNGDGRDDLAHFFTLNGAAEWWVSLATNSSSFNTTRWR